MLLQFSVSNFRSFRKLQTLNLAASVQDKTLVENCIECELPGISSKRWLKGAAIYGANASGKSTVIDALKALEQLVVNSAKMTDPKEPISHIRPFSLCTSEDLVPTAFEVSFVAEGLRYAYRVAATSERIWHESLRAYPTSRSQTYFRRNWVPEQNIYQWGPDRPTDFVRDERLEKDTLSNMLFLSKHIASNRTELDPVFRWFKEKLHFLHLDANWHLESNYSVRHVKDNTALGARIKELLRHADLGVAGARIVEQEPSRQLLEMLSKLPTALRDNLAKGIETPTLEPELIHRGLGGAEFPLPWATESAGTQRLFALAGIWLKMLQAGDVFCIDELDTSMHPLMVIELLRLLFNVKENSNGAQVIFTTHNPVLLDTTLLRRDQVWFTDKNKEGESHLYPLTEYAPRKEESLIRGYLSGRYGGLPFLPKGLLGKRQSFTKFEPSEQTAKE